MINLPDDFLQQFKEMQNDVKENSKVTMELSFSLKAFMQTQALEQKQMRKDIDASQKEIKELHDLKAVVVQNTKDISEIKADKKFMWRTAIAEIIKYAVLGICVLVALTK
jgi:Holliday junction resolvase RusA-like endonuclease